MAGLRSVLAPMAAAVRCALGLALLLAVASPARAQQTPEDEVLPVELLLRASTAAPAS